VQPPDASNSIGKPGRLGHGSNAARGDERSEREEQVRIMPIVDIRGQSIRRGGQELVSHLESFQLDLKFSAGVWFFAPGGGRFHDRYVPRKSMEQILDEAAALKDHGLAALEAHYPAEVNEDNLDLWKGFLKDSGIRLVTLVPGLFFDAQFEFGSLSSPVKEAREAAISRTKRTLELNLELGTDFAIVWPGIDGYELSFGQNHIAARDRFADGLAEAMDAVPGVRICIEPKPYEPRANILYGTTPEALLLCEKVEQRLGNKANRAILAEGHALMGLNPEVGHVMMAFEDLAYAFGLVMEYGRLGHTHWNSQPAGNYDQDQNTGVISPEQAEAALYALKMHGFGGYFGIDINPERMPVERALVINMNCLRGMNERINGLDHARIVEMVENPQVHRGELEDYLVRVRYAEGASRFTSLP
jgi:xylose isomerase